MKRIFLLATIACFAVSLAWAGEPTTANARCGTCAPLIEGLQRDLPQLFGEGAAFAAAGDNLSVWMPTEGILKANPNSDISLNGNSNPTTPTITVPKPAVSILPTTVARKPAVSIVPTKN